MGGESLAVAFGMPNTGQAGQLHPTPVVPVATTLGQRMGVNSTAALPQPISLVPSDV